MPLHIACGNGHVDAARLLLDKGAEVDRANQNGTTPLHVACQNGHVDAKRLLLDKGADVDQSRNGVTLLFLASERPRRRGATVAGKKRGGRPGAGEWYDAAVRRLPARPRRRGAAVVRKGRGGRSGDELGCDAAVHRKITAPLGRRRAARGVPTTTTRKAAPPTAAVGRPVLYLPRAVQGTRVDEVQSQLLPQVHHGRVSDEPADESSPVSVLQAARAFGRASRDDQAWQAAPQLTRRGK